MSDNQNDGLQGADPDLGDGSGLENDDPEGMAGQLDDSSNGLDEGDDLGDASRGVPQQP
jgi:hypothetical protein